MYRPHAGRIVKLGLGLPEVYEKMPVGAVVFVIGSMRIGGAEKQLALLANGLAQRGWQVDIFCLEGSEGLADGVLAPEVRLHSGGWNSLQPRWLKILLLLRAQWRLAALCVRARADVVHAFLPLANLIGAVAGKITARRMVITSRRALGTHQDKNRLWIATDRVANWLSDCITANSKAVAADTIARDGVDEGRIKIIYNGIDVAPYDAGIMRRDTVRAALGVSPDSVVIACVSNLLAYKGHMDLLPAFASVCAGRPAATPPLTLLLAGEDRGMGERLKRRAEELGISNLTRFLGCRSDVPDILAASDIGVLPSHEEGFANALLEMLAAGLPVVATDVGGNREALAGMDGCYLVPPSEPKAMTDALYRLMAVLPERHEQRAARVELIRSRFQVVAMVDRYEKLYREGR